MRLLIPRLHFNAHQVYLVHTGLPYGCYRVDLQAAQECRAWQDAMLSYMTRR